MVILSYVTFDYYKLFFIIGNVPHLKVWPEIKEEESSYSYPLKVQGPLDLLKGITPFLLLMSRCKIPILSIFMDISVAVFIGLKCELVLQLSFLSKIKFCNLIEFSMTKNYSEFEIFFHLRSIYFQINFIKTYSSRIFQQCKECTQIPL